LLVGKLNSKKDLLNKSDAFKNDLPEIEKFCDEHEMMFKMFYSDENNLEKILEKWAVYCNRNCVMVKSKQMNYCGKNMNNLLQIPGDSDGLNDSVQKEADLSIDE